LKRRFSQPSVLWAATVCISGGGKSPGQDAALFYPRELQEKCSAEHKRTAEDHRLAMASFKAKGNKRGADSGQPPEAPAKQKLLATNATLEGVAAAVET